MRRLISRIGVKSPAQIAEERRGRELVLPHYLQAWRRVTNDPVTVIAVSATRMLGTDTIWLRGRDQHQTWSWEGLYNRRGIMISQRGEYAPPKAIWENFIPSLLDQGFIDVKQAGGRLSGKQVYDYERWRRFKQGRNHEHDDEWRSHLSEKQFNQFMIEGTYPL